MKLHVTLRFCSNCHTPVEDDATYCFECGKELNFPETKSNASQVTGSGNYTKPTTRYGSSPTELTYEHQDQYGKQQGKNYRRNRVSSRMISRIISFAILMAVIYALSYLFLD